MACSYRKDDEIDVIEAAVHGHVVNTDMTKKMLNAFANNSKFREDMLKADKITGKRSQYSVLHEKQFTDHRVKKTVSNQEMAEKVQKEKARMLHA